MMITWKEWSHKFLHGDKSLMAVYGTLVLFAVAITMLIFSVVFTQSPIIIILLIFATLSFYAVFTDEVAHLFPYNTLTAITPHDWFYKKFMHLRTHDAYGIIIGTLTLLLSVWFLLWGFTFVFQVYSLMITVYAVSLFSFFIICNFVNYGFYH